MSFQSFYSRAFAISILCILIWIWNLAPYINKLPSDFSYNADVISFDNFYNQEKQEYEGEQRSVAKLAYKAVAVKKGVIMLSNTFNVHQVTGETIFSVERLYGIHEITRKHLIHFGDRDREGYLFAPQHLQKGAPFTYWHINYDGPAHMNFVGEEYLHNLKVYKYETRYEGEHIDQTQDLTFLPEVGITRGVQVEPHLELWIEPTTGRLVKYADDTIAYFYDLETGKRLSPWNHFRNTFTPESVEEQVRIASREKILMIVIETLIPIIIVILLLCFACFFFMPKKVAIRVVAGLAGFLFLAVTVLSLRMFRGKSVDMIEPVVSMDVGILPLPGGGPLFVAMQNGYVAKQGLELRIQLFDSGKAALTALLADKNLDMVVVAQTPIVAASFTRNDFAIVAGLSQSSNDSKVLIRNDRGIKIVEDLRGKKIGVTKGTTGHYFLGLFLGQYNVSFDDVDIEDLPASELAEALASGQVDAISSWEPYIFNAQQKLASNASILPSKNTFRTDYYLVAKKDWIANNQTTIRRLIQALEDANVFINNYPQKSAEIIADSTKLQRPFVQSVLNDYIYKLFVDQAILLSLEQQARWMMSNSTQSIKTLPNYLNFINTNALRMVDSAAVTIIE